MNIHELAVTESILKVVLKHAEASNAQKVVSIDLKVGEMRDFVEEWMQWYFDYLSKGTVAEESKINVTKIPVKFQCKECAENFNADVKEKEIYCPCCESKQVELVSGTEFFIESIGVI